ncbi:hypothetical protein DFH09DRAFT_937255, partial [Mycena vulgaris]
PFPVGTRGFLYYYAPPDLPPMAGGLRFRITPASRPSSFPDGFDLLREGPAMGGPPPDHRLRLSAAKRSFRNQLLAERLVSHEDLERCRAVSPTKKRLDPKITLYRLNQPFPVAFHHWPARSGSSTTARRRRSPGPTPTCSALAQFERSALPEHAGTDTLVMRIVKMLTAPTCVLPDYDGYLPPPAEGALVHRRMGHARAVRLQPWHCDVAGPSDSAAALRILVEVRRLPFFSSFPSPFLPRAKTKPSTPTVCRAVFTSHAL